MMTPTTLPAPPVTRPLRVLIADDNQDAADSLRDLLQHTGHAAAVCHDGGAVVPLAETFRPDVCILDLWMPVATGWEAARRLREWAAGRPLLLIALTGLPDRDEQSREAGFDRHMLKSTNPREIVSCLAAYAARLA
jgi:CheY-like chemotaxis protein